MSKLRREGENRSKLNTFRSNVFFSIDSKLCYVKTNEGNLMITAQALFSEAHIKLFLDSEAQMSLQIMKLPPC